MFNFEQTTPPIAPMHHVHGAAVAVTAPLPKLMTSRQANQQEDTYFRVMRLLEEQPDLTQRELAEQLGVSVSGVNYCLKALMEKGWLKMNNFAHSKNKFGYAYVLTPQGLAEKAALTARFLKRKMEEYEALKAEIEALQIEHSKTVLNDSGSL